MHVLCRIPEFCSLHWRLFLSSTVWSWTRENHANLVCTRVCSRSTLFTTIYPHNSLPLNAWMRRPSYSFAVSSRWLLCSGQTHTSASASLDCFCRSSSTGRLWGVLRQWPQSGGRLLYLCITLPVISTWHPPRAHGLAAPLVSCRLRLRTNDQPGYVDKDDGAPTKLVGWGKCITSMWTLLLIKVHTAHLNVMDREHINFHDQPSSRELWGAR